MRRLGADIDYWPVHARAMVKSLAGRHDELTEEEVTSLSSDQQRQTRGVRLEKRLASSDVSSATFEEAQLEQLDEEETEDAIPDSRWALLFDRGDFEFMTESSRVLAASTGTSPADPPSSSVQQPDP